MTVDRITSLGSLIDHWAEQKPAELAVKSSRIQLSFAQLHGQAEQFACYLQSLGIKPGDHIALVSNKDARVVVAALGIWKAGAVYAPIDRDVPASRFEILLASLEACCVIADDSMLETRESSLSAYQCLSLTEVMTPRSAATTAAGSNHAERDALPVVRPQDTAYILHTSGSTGTPKGVQMSHGSVVAYFHGHNEVLGFDESSYCLNNAPFHFDVSIQDIFLPLNFGASVYISNGLPIAASLLSILENERITHLIAVATILTIITGDGSKLSRHDLSAIRVVMTGAETCDVAVINAWFDACSGVRVINGYGPTEANSISLAYLIDSADTDRQEFFPIGKPLSSVTALLLDEEDNVIHEPGTMGQLVIGGEQLMDGYWKKPDETREAFVFIDGQRFYRTGDLAHREQSGNYCFDGRNDAEVKIAGRRINLTEVQASLMRVADSRKVVVGTVEVNEQTHIAAIVFAPGKDELSERKAVVASLRKTAASELPGYMVPVYIAIAQKYELTGSGKVNVKQLMKRFNEVLLSNSESDYELSTDSEFKPMQQKEGTQAREKFPA